MLHNARMYIICHMLIHYRFFCMFEINDRRKNLQSVGGCDVKNLIEILSSVGLLK